MAEERKHMGKDVPGVVIPVAPTRSEMDSSYASFINELKETVRSTRIQVTLQANAQLIMMYWRVGKMILEAQEKEGWGARVIDRISLDLKSAFPDMKGFSASNLKNMRYFAREWPDLEIGQRCVVQLPWRSNLALLAKLNNEEDRLWYAEQAIENGWSRDVLVMQIESHLKERSGKAVSNFDATLPPADSDLAIQGPIPL